MIRSIFLLVNLLIWFGAPVHGKVYPVGLFNTNTTVHNFTTDTVAGATEYRFYVAEGNLEDYQLINTNSFARVGSKKPVATIYLTAFFKGYSWFSIANVGGKWIYSDIRHFMMNGSPRTDPNMLRLRVQTNKLKGGRHFVATDVNKIIYDMEGNPVWVLDVDGGVRDLKISGKNLATLLVGDEARAYDHSGRKVWQAPEVSGKQGDVVEKYHHEVCQLKNGNFMVMSIEPAILEWVKDAQGRTNLKRASVKELAPGFDSSKFTKTGFGTLIEYTPDNKVAWYWSSAAYYLSLPGFKGIAPGDVVDIHQNAFYFDEAAKKIYINGKGASDILKIDYPSGKILAHYGDGYGKNKGFDKYSMFCDQHGLKKFADGCLYVFNNNLCGHPAHAKIAGFAEINPSKGQLKKVWEYEYKNMPDSIKSIPSTNGGCVQELGNGLAFACYGVPVPSMFIVNKNKEFVWDAVMELRNGPEAAWRSNPEYRAYVINEENLLHFLGLEKEGYEIGNY